MKIILAADLHVEKGIRTNSILNLLEEIENYYLQNNYDYVFMLGDIFDKASSVKNEAFIPLFLKLLNMKEKGIKFLFILGNHDIYNTDNSSLVEVFAPIGKVIKKNTHSSDVEEFKDKDWWFVPYTKLAEDIPASGQYLFSHLSIADFDLGNAYHATEKFAIKTDVFKGFDHVFVGHFHKHQTFKNITYIGSSVQINRTDEGVDKGWLTLDTDSGEYEFHVFNNYPKFLTISSSDIKRLNEIDFSNKLVYVNIDKKISDISKLKYVLFSKGAVSVNPVFVGENKEIALENKVEFDGNVQKIAEEYINNLNLEEIKGFDLIGIKKEVLLKMFEKIVEECK